MSVARQRNTPQLLVTHACLSCTSFQNAETRLRVGGSRSQRFHRRSTSWLLHQLPPRRFGAVAVSLEIGKVGMFVQNGILTNSRLSQKSSAWLIYTRMRTLLGQLSLDGPAEV